MGLFKTIKVNAKRALSGAWGRAIGVLLLSAMPTMLINALEYGIRTVSGIPEFIDYSGTPPIAFDDMSNVALVSSIISILITLLLFIVVTPLSQGAVRWYYRRTGGENEGVTELFYYFETARGYFKSLWLYFQMNLRMLIWGLLLGIPLYIGGGVLYASSVSGNELPAIVYTTGYILASIWILLMIIFLMLISLRYFLAPYLLAEHPDIKVRLAIKKSVKMVRGHKGSLFVFQLSFILWWIPAIFALLLAFPAVLSGMLYMMEVIGIIATLLIIQFGLLFYVVPYMNAANTMYGRYLIQLNEGDGEELYVDTTREYEYKPEIDRYMEEQALRNNESGSEQ